jgi:RNA polymerase sigma-70 factor (ECF subfamily)
MDVVDHRAVTASGASYDLERGVDEAWAATTRLLRDFIVRRVEDSATADDITQDVLVRVYRARGELADIASMPAWLHRIARNAIIDHYRIRRAHRPLPTDDALDQAVDEREEVGPNQATQELARCLRPLIDQLPDKYRQAVTLVDLDGHTQVATARELGLSLSGTKSRVQRGRRQLRQLLTACCVIATDRTGAVSGYTAHPDSGCECSGQSSRCPGSG